MPRTGGLVRLVRLNAEVTSDSHDVYTRHDQNGIVVVWKRGKKLGEGGFGAVYREECIEGQEWGKLRAVKIIQKLSSGNATVVDYSQELEAIARFSQPQVSPTLNLRMSRVDMCTHSISSISSGHWDGTMAPIACSSPWNTSRMVTCSNMSGSVCQSPRCSL